MTDIYGRCECGKQLGTNAECNHEPISMTEQLTREQVLALTAEPELNALVAKHVFGQEVYLSRDEWAEAGRPHMQYWSEHVRYPAYWNESYMDCLAVTDYSYDIYAAWEVADKLKIAIIPQSPSAPNELKYLARAEWDYKHKEIDVFAATAPEAICKAALLAVMGL